MSIWFSDELFMLKYSTSNWRSYFLFLKTNRSFKIFWLAGVISQFGHWFNYIAIFVLLEQLTGSGQAVSWFLIAKFIPSTLFGPAAGVLVDRYSRKNIMIFCDLLRIAVVLAFLFVTRPEQVWIIYGLAIMQESLWTLANPARQASVPNLCSPEELNIANALSGATWSLLLALGAACGGFVTSIFGWQMAIKIDALTFLASALLLNSLVIPDARSKGKDTRKGKTALTWRHYTGISDLAAGAKYVIGHRKVAALMLVKSGWALSGGILVMLVIFGEQVFGSNNQGWGSGLLYSCRGLGAAVGPILAWQIIGEESPAMMKGIAVSFFISAAAYISFSQMPMIFLAALFVFLGHIGGAVQWVFSMVLLQRVVDDEYRGRVFAAEMALVTLVLSLSTYFTGAALDAGIDPRRVALLLGCLFLLPGVGWGLYIQHRKKLFAAKQQ